MAGGRVWLPPSPCQTILAELHVHDSAEVVGRNDRYRRVPIIRGWRTAVEGEHHMGRRHIEPEDHRESECPLNVREAAEVDVEPATTQCRVAKGFTAGWPGRLGDHACRRIH